MKYFLALKHNLLPDTYGHIMITQDKILTTPIPRPVTVANTMEKLKKWYKGTVTEHDLDDYSLVKISWKPIKQKI